MASQIPGDRSGACCRICRRPCARSRRVYEATATRAARTRGIRFADFVSDIEAFLDALGIPAALVVGHSMGSYVAQRVAMQYPERVLGLVLMGSFPTLRHNAPVRELWETAVSSLADPVDRDFVLSFQQSTLARPVPAALLDSAVDESLKVPARVWRATFADFLEADFSADLPLISAPTLIAWGDRDAFVSLDDQMVLHAAIADSRFDVYPGGGHAFHWEDPAAFASDLVAFGHEILALRPNAPRR